MAYIGIDVGTTGSKATVIEKNGAVILSVYYEYDLRFPAPGYVEMRPEDVWASVRRALTEAAAQYGKPIDAIATASFGEAVVLLDAEDKPVCDSIFYTDIRGSESLAKLRSTVDPEELELKTGMPINSMYSLPKLMWLKSNRPEVLDKTKKVMPYGSYIAYRLTGVSAVDGSLASRTLLFDRNKCDWDMETLAAFGIERAWLPEYVPAGQPVGRILRSVVQSLGIQGEPMVVSGVHDQIAAALGAGALHSGDVTDGIGGAECITAVLPEQMDLKGMFRYNICAEPYVIPGKYLALVFNNTAGAALKWYRDTFEQELRAKCAAEGLNTYAELNKLITDAPSPLLFLPHLSGTGTPHMDAKARGMLSGLSLNSTRGDIYRAILEGNNFEMRYNVELMEKFGLRVDALNAVGGGAAPEALRIKADIMKKPVHMLNTVQAGTVGMVILCGHAVKQFSSFDEGVHALVRRIGTIEPDPAYQSIYDEKYAQYVRMYDAARMIYGR